MTPEQLARANLRYSSFLGQLVWIVNNNRARAGKVAGSVNSDGYRSVVIDGSSYRVHRLVWSLFNGPIPEKTDIDHIDGNKDRNCIDNLRLASRMENCLNKQFNKNNTTGVKGLSWCERDGLWIARVRAYGKTHRKYTSDREEAVEWLQTIREFLSGEFTNHGTHLKDQL